MGTNYYAIRQLCDKCGSFKKTHIGKQSHGWRFTFATYRAAGLTNVVAWVNFLLENNRVAITDLPWIIDNGLIHTIIDEYGQTHSAGEFFGMVLSRQDGIYEGHLLDDQDFSFAKEGEWS